MESLMGFLGILMLLGVVIIYNAFSWGFVVYKFYYWYALWLVPTLPHITFYQAVAISMLLSLFKNHTHQSIEDEYRDKGNELMQLIFMPWIAIVIGWFIQSAIK